PNVHRVDVTPDLAANLSLRTVLTNPIVSDVVPTVFLFFFFNDTATTEIYTLSLHDALPILIPMLCVTIFVILVVWFLLHRSSRSDRKSGSAGMPRPISYAVFCLKKKKSSDTSLSGGS